MTANEESIVVGLGEMQVRKGTSAVLSCIGLGSCIALCAYDPVAKVGGVAHMVLPTGGTGDKKQVSPKYVDTGVSLLFQEMSKQGAVKSRLVIKTAGGAQMLSIPGANGRLNVGERNIAELELALAKEGVSAAATDVGGTRGRSVKLFLDTGRVMVRTVEGVTSEL